MTTGEAIWQVFHDSFLMAFRVAVELFGGIFLIGLLLYFLARFTRTTFAKSFGARSEIYFTAWIGTPVHELGHAVFCVLFGHRIRKITWFKPNAKDGSLGSVEHSYNSRNIYHNIGNFFIGAGPLFFGSLVIMLLIRFLLPSGSDVFELLKSDPSTSKSEASGIIGFLSAIAGQTLSVIPAIFSVENLSRWQFWLFMYLSLAVSSHMALSPPDFRQMWRGLLVIVLLIFVISLIYAIFFNTSNNFRFPGIPAFVLLDRMLMVGLLFSLINFLVTLVIGSVYSMLFRGRMINPLVR